MTEERRAPSDVVPWAVRVSAAWSWRFLLLVASVAVGLYLITILKVIVVPVAVALLLTVLLLPLVRWLQRRARLPRAAASGVAVLGLLVVVIGLLTVAGRSIGTRIAPSTSDSHFHSVCTSTPSASATSTSSGARQSFAASALRAAVMSRVLRRTDRGTWSWRRSSSRIAPRMRGTANVLKARPRSGSNDPIAAISPSVPALTSSS